MLLYKISSTWFTNLTYDDENILKVVKVKFISSDHSIISDKSYVFKNCTSKEASLLIADALKSTTITNKKSLEYISDIYVDISDAYRDQLIDLMDFIDEVNDINEYKFRGTLHLIKRSYVTKELYNKLKSIKNTTE